MQHVFAYNSHVIECAAKSNGDAAVSTGASPRTSAGTGSVGSSSSPALASALSPASFSATANVRARHLAETGIAGKDARGNGNEGEAVAERSANRRFLEAFKETQAFAFYLDKTS
jgi:hypothetical protein